MSLSLAEISSFTSPTADVEENDRSKILVLSSSLLTDRMLLHTEFLPALSKKSEPSIWATSALNPCFRSMWRESPVQVEQFPEVRPYKDFPYFYLRRVNEFAWDCRLRPPSRIAGIRHLWLKKDHRFRARAVRIAGRAVALVRGESAFEEALEKVLLAYPRSQTALERLQANRPAVIVSTGPFQYEQPAVTAAAKNLSIPTLALIPSWDNISTKSRMVFRYDGYLVWSEQTKRELQHFYPQTRQAPIYVVGAPQFDTFFQPRFVQTREEFCASEGLKPNIPIIVYAIGSPNLIQEHHGAVAFAKRVVRGDLGDVQLVIRPHPLHDNGELTKLFEGFGPRVTLQRTSEANTPLNARSQDKQQIIKWVNSFRHADVVVNLSSTVAVDAAIFDRPVVNLDYDPEPGQPNQALVKEINHRYTHFKPIAESGGLWLANNLDEVVEGVRAYLEHPELHREKRRWIAEYVCGYVDGKCGERMAEAILDFVHHQTHGATMA